VTEHTHAATSRTEWAVRLDRDEIVSVADRTAAERATGMFRNRAAEVVHRHVTITEWSAASHDHEATA
jgi:hypothetical protein